MDTAKKFSQRDFVMTTYSLNSVIKIVDDIKNI